MKIPERDLALKRGKISPGSRTDRLALIGRGAGSLIMGSWFWLIALGMYQVDLVRTIASGSSDESGSELRRAGAAEKMEIETRIDNLTTQAMSAPAQEVAQEKLEEARQLLQQNSAKLKKLTEEFLSINIDQTWGRVQAAAWQSDPNQEALRAEARVSLGAAQLAHKALQEKAQDEAAKLERMLGAKVEANQWWQQVCGYITRIDYNLAWMNYSLALVADDEASRQGYLQKAIDGFKKFTETGYRYHPVIAECFLGQALCLYEQQRYYQVLKFLDLELITPANTPPETFKRITYLRIKAARRVPSELNAAWAAEQYFSAREQDRQLDSVELEIALEWAHSLMALTKGPTGASYLRNLEQRLDEVGRLIYPYGDPWCAKLAELLKDVPVDTPFGCLLRARRCFAQKQYEQAFRYADKGVWLMDWERADRLSADLLYLKIAASWNRKYWHQAYLAAGEFLSRHEKDERAEEICRRGIQAGIRAVKEKQQIEPTNFIKFLDYVQKHWPQYSEMEKAPWYRGWALLEARRYAEAEQVLVSIPEESSVYPQALYGLALAAYQLAQTDAEAAREHLLKAAAVVDQFVHLPEIKLSEGEESVGAGVLEVGTLTAQDLLVLAPAELDAAFKLLGNLELLLSADDADHMISTGKKHPVGQGRRSPAGPLARWARLRAVQMEAYAAAGNNNKVMELMSDLIKTGSPDEQVMVALMKVGAKLEKACEGSLEYESNETIRDVDKILVNLYQYLLEHTGGAEKESPIVAESGLRRHLAQSLARCSRFQEAIEQYQWLLQNIPRNKSGDVMRSLALIYERIHSYEAALEQWRALVKGLVPQTEAWLEANYHLIICHQRAGRAEQAGKLLALFRLRYPDLDSTQWRESFAQLDLELNETVHN